MDREIKLIDVETLQQFEPIASLSKDQIEELALKTTLQTLNIGTQLFVADRVESESIYLISGTLETKSGSSDEKRLITGGSPEARYPLFGEKTHYSTAVATTTTEIFHMDKELLDTILTWGQISAPETEVVMCEDGIMTIDKGSWLKSMIKSPTFRKLPPANIEELLYRLEPIRVKAGDLIIRQGDAGDYFYMIDEGVALVTRNPDDDEDSIEMAELGQGRSFGEAALISDKPRNATVTMMSDGILLRLSKDNFIKLLKEPTLQWWSFEEAKSKVAEGALWIDVRLKSEYEYSCIPGATNIPMQALHIQARDLDKTVTYICYCQTGRRSSAAAFVLAQYGLQASVLQDGLGGIPENTLSTPAGLAPA